MGQTALAGAAAAPLPHRPCTLIALVLKPWGNYCLLPLQTAGSNGATPGPAGLGDELALRAEGHQYHGGRSHSPHPASESHGARTLGRGRRTIRARGPMPPNIHPNLKVRLLVVLDMEEGTLGCATGGTYLGPAFHRLKSRTLYPAVSAVCGQCQVCIGYLGENREEPHSLLHLSCLCVCQALGAARLGQVSALPLPPAMKYYLLYQ
uniref:SOCS box domain-containing protein n=1 Tax=Rousettus aegyptiacus TaxID=9407 RepID=A0A7J8ILR0_ROUAE|nr:hypothetical protein HJG63_010740 [Rousettus aegyptiacus]